MTWISRWFRKPDLVKDAELAQAREHSERWPFSLPLFWWDANTCFTLADAATGLHAWGVTGSGKSTATMATVTRAYLSAGAMGALCLTAKAEDVTNYLRYAREAGREHDVLLLGPDHPLTFNFLAEIATGGAGVLENLCSLLAIVASLVRGNAQHGGQEDGAFWQRMQDQLIRCCGELLLLAHEPLTTINLTRLIMTIPHGRDQVGDAAWQGTSYLFACLRAAEARVTHPESREDIRRLADHFLLHYATLGDKTRSVVDSSATSLLDMFNRQPMRRLLCAENPSFDMTMLQRGKILIVDYPVLVYRDAARLVQMVLKLCFQNAQNRRDITANPRPVALIADESHLLMALAHDAAFQTTARGTRTCVAYASQSISNYLSDQGGSQAEAQAHALLGNLRCHVIHQTTDPKHIEYFQSLLGKRKHLLMQGGTNRQTDDWVASALGLPVGNTGANAGYAEHLDHLVQADDLHALRTGGPESNWIVDGLVYMGGRAFAATGKPYLPVSFLQDAAPARASDRSSGHSPSNPSRPASTKSRRRLA